ncbi:MAG: amino acid ABC transporter substrate-binding protein [Rickettsiales bacterium]|nr:MAG: amino acid ABC transporter substrate-binding protein [Rickettsiales bacterium]
MKVKNLLLSLVMVIATLLLGTSNVSAAKKIRLGTDATYAPFEFVDKNNKIVGFDIDLSRAVLTKLGYEVEIVNVDFGGLIAALVSGKIDIIASGMVSNPERLKVINFSNGYYVSGAKLAVNKDNNTIKSIADIKGRKIGAEIGSTSVQMIRDAGGEVVEYNGNPDLVMALKTKKIEGLVANATAILDSIKADKKANIKLVGDYIVKADICFGINKNNTELLEGVNRVLAEMRKSGEYNKLVKKWLE